MDRLAGEEEAAQIIDFGRILRKHVAPDEEENIAPNPRPVEKEKPPRNEGKQENL